MFERLKGVIEEIGADNVVVGTDSFSYIVNISLRTLQEIPPLGERVELFLHPVFRDSGIDLYGFDNKDDREIFRDLLSVSKIGPKTALSLLSLYSRDELIRHIAGAAVKELTRASGLGKRGAEMIITALKDKYKDVPVSPSGGAVERLREQDQVFSQAVEALTSLGYSWEVASESVRNQYRSGMILEDLIKEALINING